jgi:hypothetical protein
MRRGKGCQDAVMRIERRAKGKKGSYVILRKLVGDQRRKRRWWKK